jgi:hypothetical protein
MTKRFAVAAVLLVCAFALGAEQAKPAQPAQQPLYQIDLVDAGKANDTGKIISRDLPTLKGTVYVFHVYPAGTLTSVRKSAVKQISQLSPAAVAAANPTALKPIGDLAMQGPKSAASGGGPRNMGRARAAVSAANAGTAARTGGN